MLTVKFCPIFKVVDFTPQSWSIYQKKLSLCMNCNDELSPSLPSESMSLVVAPLTALVSDQNGSCQKDRFENVQARAL